MVWLAVYAAVFLLLLITIILYARGRRIPQKCFSCAGYEECARNGKCSPGAAKATLKP